MEKLSGGGKKVETLSGGCGDEGGPSLEVEEGDLGLWVLLYLSLSLSSRLLVLPSWED